MTPTLYQIASAPFEAARRLQHLPADHRARRWHGHSFRARVRAAPPAPWAGGPTGAADALLDALCQQVDRLNYSALNSRMEDPTDEAIAHYLRQRLEVPGIAAIGIQSTSAQATWIDENATAVLSHRFRFEAAHQLPRVAPGHPCGRMHGHGFEVILHARRAPLGADTGSGYDQLASAWAPCQSELHHACLNDLPGLENPTSERIAHWLWQRLQPSLPSLCWISVHETRTAGCHFDGQHYRIWKDQRWESALRLRGAPEGDPRRHLHGHSYLLRLHLCAPLDAVFGWTIDYGDVKALFEPLRARLDHDCLDTLPELSDADAGSLAEWIRAELAACLPQLDRIDLYPTPACGSSLCWGTTAPAPPW